MGRYPVHSVHYEANRELPCAGISMRYLGAIRARAVAEVPVISDRGHTASFGLRETSHYVAPVIAWNIPSGWTLRASPTFGLNDNSHRFMIRWGIAKEFSGFGDLVKKLFGGRS